MCIIFWFNEGKRMEKTIHSTTVEKQQNNNQLETLIDEILSYGDLLLIANKGVGKTNALKVLASEMRKLPETRVIIFETFPKFALEFENIPFMRIQDRDVTETQHTVDMEDYFLRHERDFSVKRGTEINEALTKYKDLIFTLEIRDIERIAFFVYSVVNHFYRLAYLRLYKRYNKTERVIFIVEESQNIFDSSTISKKLFNRMRKIFSEARNLDLHFVMCSQRLQDLNTKIRGRTRLMLGNVSIDDYELKVRRLLRNSAYKTEILSFERGQFLYVATDKVIKFPKFETENILDKPWEIQPQTKPQPKKKGFFGKVWDILTIPAQNTPPNNNNNDEDLDESEEESELPIWEFD